MAIKGDVWFNSDLIGKIVTISEMLEALMKGQIVLCTKDQLKELLDEIENKKIEAAFTFLRYQDSADENFDAILYGVKLAYDSSSIRFYRSNS